MEFLKKRENSINAEEELQDEELKILDKKLSDIVLKNEELRKELNIKTD